MEEFYDSNPINRDLYQVYQELITYKDMESIPVKSIFNEVYYQCTRIVYENNPEPDFDAIEMDIKANVGTRIVLRLVYRMMYALLTARTGNSREVEKVRNRLEIYSDIMTRNSNFRAFIREYSPSYHKRVISLLPNPAEPETLKYQPIDWAEATCDFDGEATRMVVDLWADTEDKKSVLSLMSRYCTHHLRFKNYKEYSLEKEKIFRQGTILLTSLKRELKETEENCTMVAEPIEAITLHIGSTATLKEKDREIAMLKSVNKMLRTQNEELLARLNQNEPVSTKERSFTFTQILDFGENHTDREEGRVIIKMLNFFLRNAGNSTETERDKVDALEHKMLNPETGDNVMGNKNSFSGNARLVNLQMPQDMSAAIEKVLSKYLIS